MKFSIPVRSKPRTLVYIQIVLSALLLLAVWIFKSFRFPDGSPLGGGTIELNLGKFEAVLIIILALICLYAVYLVFKAGAVTGSNLRLPVSIILVGILVSAQWLLLTLQGGGSIFSGQTIMTVSVESHEVFIVLLLIFLNIFATLHLFGRFQRMHALVQMSAYSKKVLFEGQWISIEEFLKNELGMQVSHGATPDEQQEVIERFRRELEQR